MAFCIEAHARRSSSVFIETGLAAGHHEGLGQAPQTAVSQTCLELFDRFTVEDRMARRDVAKPGRATEKAQERSQPDRAVRAASGSHDTSRGSSSKTTWATSNGVRSSGAILRCRTHIAATTPQPAWNLVNVSASGACQNSLASSSIRASGLVLGAHGDEHASRG